MADLTSFTRDLMDACRTISVWHSTGSRSIIGTPTIRRSIDGDSDAFTRSHCRREALRRAGIVERIDPDCWEVPNDFVK